MNKIKKYLSLALAFCMVASLTLGASAAEISTISPEPGEGVSAEEETAGMQESPETDITAVTTEQISEGEISSEPVSEETEKEETKAQEAEPESAEETEAEPEMETETETETVAEPEKSMENAGVTGIDATRSARDTSGDDFYKIVHVDAGRKYFSPANIKAIVDNAAKAGFNQVELYLSDNQGFRLALDDMKITTSTENTYDLTSALGDGYSDGSKYPDGSGKYLTQNEMTDIISYARNKGIEIVPCINVPGHMGAILEEFPDFRYSGSKSSIDLENEEAVAFALAVTEKYAAYFADQGVKYYNLGADEYANDMSTMGFQGLYTSGKYGEFAEFLNDAAQIVINHGMTPRAFNDGICYNNNTSYNINKAIQVCYWSSGWGGYNVASASTLNSEGYDLINAHGDYYWVLGSSNWQCSAEKAAGFDYTAFQGGTVEDPAGAMFCIWCDNGAADGQDDGAKVVSATADVIAAFGAALNPSKENTVTCENGTVSVTALGLTSLTCKEATAPVIEGAEHIKAYDIVPMIDGVAYTGEATVSVKVPEGWNTANMGAFVVNSDKTVETIKGTYADGVYTYTAPHFSVGGIYDVAAASEDVTEKEISIALGETIKETINGANYAGDYTTEDPSVATVEVTGQDAAEAKTEYTQVSATCDNLINDDSNSWKDTGYYYLADGNYYPVYAKRSYNWRQLQYTYTWGYSKTGSSSDVTQIGTQSTYWTSTNTNITVYTKTETQAAEASSTITFTGVSVGTTSVTVGNTRYAITVYEDLTKVTPLTVEYWITNSKVYTTSGDTSSASAKTISAEDAYGEEGVEIKSLIPETAYSNYDGWLELHFWQAMRLDSANHQNSDAGNDKTAVGTSFSKIRYYNSSWQYMTADGSWHSFAQGDQAVAYYMRHTAITKEVTTAMKDWGYGTNGTTPNTSGGNGQSALTVAVVYPDGTVSPAEGDMYADSTIIFNYWSGRDIGIIAPLSNADYDISKITVTDGRRNGNSNENVWYSSDEITWNKTTNAAGSEWYDETEVWNDSMGTEAVVNGKASNITWSAKNTAKLVLIYLKPVQKDSNLTVNWVDDSANGSLIHTNQIVVSGESTTFLNGLKQKSEVKSGTFTLDDDAYITNSSNVNQTINKDITVIQGVAGQYTSGLYTYTSADISEDGKTLTLHYNLSAGSLSKQYVVDFGLPVNVPLSDLMENLGNVKNVVVSSNASYDAETQTIKYIPEKILKGIEAVTARVEYTTGTPTTFNIGFVPATTVYYEEGFATYTGFTGGSKGTGTQATEAVGDKANNYGFDSSYTGVGPSNNTQATSTAYGDKATFSFTGTGLGIYANCTSETGYLFIQVKNAETKKIVQVKTAMLEGTTGATEGQSVNGYNVPVAVFRDLPHASYDVVITHMKPNSTAAGDTVNLDGFCVYGTLGYNEEAYQKDSEANPTFTELRDKVLTALPITNVTDSAYASQVASDALKQVYGDKGTTSGAVVVSSYIEGVNAKDLLDNGPKNELYLRTGESVVFNLNAANAQIGLKALNEQVTYTITGKNGNQTLSTSTDMFYSLDATGTITIANTSNSRTAILSITEIKTFGTASSDAAFYSLEAADLVPAIMSLRSISGGTTDPVEPVDPVDPAETEEPEITYADAMLRVSVVDYQGRELAAAALSANGAEGEDAVFTADDIAAAAKNVLPAGYDLVENKAAADKVVGYGEEDTVKVQAGKVATLVVTYKKLLGKSVGTVTLTKVQTSSSRSAVFSASEIKAAVPGGYRLLSVMGTVKVNYGYSSGRIMFVF